MAKIEITKTELIWPGKYEEKGKRRETEKVSFPFQVIESVNETHAAMEARKAGQQRSLFDFWEPKEGTSVEEGWKNKLIWGDNKLVMSSLLEKFAGKIHLIYIDPPFATGADFNFTTEIGDEAVAKEQSIIEEKAYRDTWGQGIDSYLSMMYDRIVMMRELLVVNGSIYIHLDWHVGHYVKVIMDEIFGSQNFRNEIVWRRIYTHSDANRYGHIHDTILFYTKQIKYIWNEQHTSHSDDYLNSHYRLKDKDGKPYQLISMSAKTGKREIRIIDGKEYYPEGNAWKYSQKTIDKYWEEGKIVFTKEGTPRLKLFLEDTKGRIIQSIWTDIYPVNSQAVERVDYATQKPEALLERIIKASSNEGDLVMDCFCGSGTTPVVAEKLGRRWIGCDLSRYAIHTTRKRLMDIENCKPFEILNLGKYERQVWQGISFNGRDRETVLYEYLAFILRLYGAEPVAGFQHIYGKKGKALIHIGAVDAPVTISEVQAAIEECKTAHQTELHVLGWEWEMGMYDLITDYAKDFGITLRLRLIPNEAMEAEAVKKGDVRFFELAYLEAKIEKNGKKVIVELTDFVIPNTELIPDEVREKIKKWSDYVDYWAIDFNFQHDTFINQWTSYRTRRDRTLKLKSDPYTYDKPGRYMILVKVIDVFGIDTSQVFEVEVK